MTKMDHRIPRAVVGIALIFTFVLITAVFSVIGHTSSANAQQNAVVQGTVNLSLANKTLSIKFALTNIPKGSHAADLHQGSCPLTFQTSNGNKSPDGPFTPGVTLKLGLVKPNASGDFNKTLTFQVGGNTHIPSNLLASGKWFFCIHTGSLAQLTRVQNPTPASLLAELKKIPASQIKQIACQAISGGSQASAKLTINGVQNNGS
jgi:hypothetical protein